MNELLNTFTPEQLASMGRSGTTDHPALRAGHPRIGRRDRQIAAQVIGVEDHLVQVLQALDVEAADPDGPHVCKVHRDDRLMERFVSIGPSLLAKARSFLHRTNERA